MDGDAGISSQPTKTKAPVDDGRFCFNTWQNRYQ
jgi:hypothetical protein